MEKKNTPVPQTATLTYNGRSIELPVVVGTEGEVGFDVSNLYAKTGHLVYDPGMANTAVCKSDISYIDGENGILRYRGIPIEKLSATHDFIETAMLLMNGKLPTVEERLNFGMLLSENANIHESMKHHFDSFPP